MSTLLLALPALLALRVLWLWLWSWLWLWLGEGVWKREGLLYLYLYLGVCGRQEWGQGMLEVGEVIWVSSMLVGVESGKVW